MVARLAFSLSAVELLINGLFQVGVIPESVWNMLEQYPPLFAVIIVAYYMHKMQKEENAINREWLDQMLTTQRGSLKDVYSTNQTFLLELLNQINSRQEQVLSTIKLLEEQLKINNATVSEIASVDSMVSDLINRLDASKEP